MKHATFFLSTGRCGTQWIAKTLGEIYGDLAVVRHEPLKAKYDPKRFLRLQNQRVEVERTPEVSHHIEFVTRTLETSDYIEAGWPAYAVIPTLIDTFPAQLRVVHLVRHPVPTALSMTTHGFYHPHLRGGEFARFTELTPFDPGVRQQHYRARWETMSEYERCLFQWTEVNTYALELMDGNPEIPFLSLKFEDLFEPGAGRIAKLLDFLELPRRVNLEKLLRKPIDDYRRTVVSLPDWREIFGHPSTMELAARFGYTLDRITTRTLKRRYKQPTLVRIKFKVQRMLERR